VRTTPAFRNVDGTRAQSIFAGVRGGWPATSAFDAVLDMSRIQMFRSGMMIRADTSCWWVSAVVAGLRTLLQAGKLRAAAPSWLTATFTYWKQTPGRPIGRGRFATPGAILYQYTKRATANDGRPFRRRLSTARFTRQITHTRVATQGCQQATSRQAPARTVKNRPPISRHR